ncbi:MAG TPA: hypothetical protein VFB75_23795 [Burkholderiales bacterium]|nr:hypothetical protein [Burkholderiales bacterium]
MRRLLQLCCIFLLLFAQQTALTHALWHAERQLPVGALEHHAAQHTHDSGDADAAALCAFDAAFGQLLGAALSGHHGLLHASITNERPHRLTFFSVPRYFLAPLSRGPPSPLVS